MATQQHPQDILNGFFNVLNALRGIEYLATGPNTIDPTEPSYHFGTLAGLLAQQQAVLCSDLTNYIEAQERGQMIT